MKKNKVFGDVLEIDPNLPDDTLVPGIAVYTSRAAALAGWTKGLELGGISVDLDMGTLILDTGVADSWQYARFRQTKELTQEAREWEQVKQNTGGAALPRHPDGRGRREHGRVLDPPGLHRRAVLRESVLHRFCDRSRRGARCLSNIAECAFSHARATSTTSGGSPRRRVRTIPECTRPYTNNDRRSTRRTDRRARAVSGAMAPRDALIAGVGRVFRHHRRVSAVLYVVGVLGVLSYPLLARKVFIDENAFLHGHGAIGFGADEALRAHEYALKAEGVIDALGADADGDQIYDALTAFAAARLDALGLDVSTREYPMDADGRGRSARRRKRRRAPTTPRPEQDDAAVVRAVKSSGRRGCGVRHSRRRVGHRRPARGRRGDRRRAGVRRVPDDGEVVSQGFRVAGARRARGFDAGRKHARRRARRGRLAPRVPRRRERGAARRDEGAGDRCVHVRARRRRCSRRTCSRCPPARPSASSPCDRKEGTARCPTRTC